METTVYKSWNYFLVGTKRFRNARHKCALRPCSDLKSRNMIALSNTICITEASSKLSSVALRAQKDLKMRATNVGQTLALI